MVATDKRAPATEEQVTDPEHYNYHIERRWISPPFDEFDEDRGYDPRFDWYFD